MKKPTVILLTMVFLLDFSLINMKAVCSNNIDGEIDLFTQKEPYSGKGPNMPSDAFSPGETVILYASVTYHEVPLHELLVTFNVASPNDGSFSFAARINSSGIATISFRIPQKCINESEVLGEWQVAANTMIEPNLFQDTLTFNVGYIIRLISLKTIDGNLAYRSEFGIEGDVGFEISLKNLAMHMKRTTLAIVIKDDVNVPVSYAEIYDFDVQPNEKLILLYCRLPLPKWTRVGTAKVIVSALTALPDEGGVPYCPAISTNFSATQYNPLTISFHDAAVVNATPSATSIELGQPLGTSVVVRNEGTEVESFNVAAHCGDMLIGALEAVALSPYTSVTLNFTFDTSLVDPGSYRITVSIPHIVNEADLTDNLFIDGVVEIKPKSPIIIHDIAVVDVNVSNDTVYIDESLQINVTVANKGTETETFDVETYYDFSLIGTLRVSTLTPGAQMTLVFVWNTAFVHEGFYQIKAYAPLPDDANISDNTLVDGVVQVKTKPTPQPFQIHDVTILSVSPSQTFVYIGEIIKIDVVVKNQGNYTETFNVTMYADLNTPTIGDEITIKAVSVEDIQPHSEKLVVFHWDTGNVEEGNYTLSALASTVSYEQNTEDNLHVNGFVTVAKPPRELYIPEWFFWFLLLLLVLVIFLLIGWLYCKKRKKAGEAFHSGWTAWYYGYNLIDKSHKSKT